MKTLGNSYVTGNIIATAVRNALEKTVGAVT